MRSKLDWAEPAIQGHAGLLAWYRTLIDLRRRIPELTDPRLDRVETECDSGAGSVVVRRGPVVVASNLGSRSWTFPADPQAELLAASDPDVKVTRQGVVLPPDTVAIMTGPYP